MQNGGNANEKIILLDRNLNVVDAVSRNQNPSSSVSITTSSVSGGCTSQSFNLSTMAISYESINTSSGIDNSFARKVDGDCGWVKTTQISAGASNKTGSTSSVDYHFSTLSASECTGTTGSISITVSANDVASLFPMNYTLAYDADSNGIFETTDHYFYGVDSSAPSIDIKDLAYGRYRITVGSSSGCNLKTFDFFIFNCYGVVLPVKLESFRYGGARANQHTFTYSISEPENIKKLTLEGLDRGVYKPVKTIYGSQEKRSGEITASLSSISYYRLHVIDKLDNGSYSPIIRIQISSNEIRFRFVPFENKILIESNKEEGRTIIYTIVNAAGTIVLNGKGHFTNGGNTITISTEPLPKGVYFLRVADRKEASFKFSKY
jgi:hypothetical protein